MLTSFLSVSWMTCVFMHFFPESIINFFSVLFEKLPDKAAFKCFSLFNTLQFFEFCVVFFRQTSFFRKLFIFNTILSQCLSVRVGFLSPLFNVVWMSETCQKRTTIFPKFSYFKTFFFCHVVFSYLENC